MLEKHLSKFIKKKNSKLLKNIFSKYPYSESQWGPIDFYFVEKNKNKKKKRKCI